MDADQIISRIAAAIGEPARVRMLFCLMDSHARTSTELAVVANVSPSTASAHLKKLQTERLIKVHAQGKHRYYSLNGPNVANALEGLSVIAGISRIEFVPNTPTELRNARTCYDHIAGKIGVLLHDRLKTLGWISNRKKNEYDLTSAGTKAFEILGIDVVAIQTLRRRFAYPCLDWSERQPHIGGALGAALLNTMIKRKWLTQDLDSRALSITNKGRREILSRFGVSI
ncbi:MAG: transcriptional regulator [Acidobacteria bacterium]|nr:MAG: transcriptional regulator [Acidobacteriota bacterium]